MTTSTTRFSNLSWAALVHLLLRVFLGGFYLLAGALKVGDPGEFAEAVANFRIVPHPLVNLVAIILPWVEIAAGLFLVLGIWLRASAWLINLLTLVFIAGITSAVARGLNIECGCFGTVGGRRVGFRAIAEDVLLLGCGVLLVCWNVRRPRPNAAQGVTGGLQ